MMQSIKSELRRRVPVSRATTIKAAIAVVLLAAVSAAATAKAGTMAPAATTDAHVVRFTPTLRLSALAGRPDTDVVEFADGRRMHLGQLRRLSAWGREVRSAPNRQFPAALRVKPAAAGRRVANAAELGDALKLPDSTTVELPSGRRATVGQIKFLMPEVEKRLGHSFSAPRRPNLSGPAVKVTAQADWKAVLRKPDNTVLEAPDGRRITVGELKDALKASGPARAPVRPNTR